MRTIARINADGSLLLRGEVFELIASWDEAQEIDDTYTIDEDTEIDEGIDFERFVEILLGIKENLVSPEGMYFDQKGNLFVNELLEGLSVKFTDGKEIEIEGIEEGVDLDA
ncbi:hypothetical protein [Alkalicoccus chagannorensis]|uniref:hypothetical protein n=1 Tax=Alkalicoccus chagannorensis TaxID=427072 RepID=UPI00041980CC|nr:hypothetical protein [Alkalicoccus chagannorensis]